MAGKYEAPRGSRRRNPKKRTDLSTIILAIVAVVLVAVAALLVLTLWLGSDDPDPTENHGETGSQLRDPDDDGDNDPHTDDPTTPTETEPKPEPVHVVSTATITSTGDVLMHLPVVNTGLTGSGGYDFTNIFKYVDEYVSAADYAVANLETTLCGTTNGYNYSGYPCFNCPDEIVDGAMAAGFDMFTTANNHCYDTRTVGLLRTLSVLEEKGMDSLGTMATAEAPKYVIKDINGIKIGMLSYTYSTTADSGRPAINGIPTSADSVGLINTFNYGQLDAFYSEVEGHLAAMEAEGAEATVIFMHWGYEYQLSPDTQYQLPMAQALCDLGIDVIIGGHPHVVQPMDLLTSTTDPEHKTVCLYSMGNAVSNQRLGLIGAIGTAHTEDGVLFSVTFSKYSDGTVVLEGADLIPCWVNMHTTNGIKEYNILPLDEATQDQWQTLYSLSDTGYTAAVNSYNRTMALVGEGLEECQVYLHNAKTEREAAYQAAVE